MSFQIKDFVSVTAGMLNHARSVTDKITDFAPGSVVRTIMEAPAVEIEELYMQMFLGLRDAIPVATFLSFGFNKLPAAKARGYASVSKTPTPTGPIQIPVGTVFSTADGRTYESTSAVTWAAGQASVRVPIACTEAGMSGNVASGVITASPAFNPTDGYIIGNSLIETGRDEETDQERETRFAEFVQSLSRGTVVACLYAARQSSVLDADGNRYEYVTRAGLQEDPGRVRIYLYSSAGLASDALIADGQLRMDGTRDDEVGTITPGFRPAGVRVDVLKMTERQINFSAQVEMQDGYTLTAAAQQAMQDVFASELANVQPGQTLYIGTLVENLLSVPGVQKVVPSVTENIYCGASEALVPGTLLITST